MEKSIVKKTSYLYCKLCAKTLDTCDKCGKEFKAFENDSGDLVYCDWAYDGKHYCEHCGKKLRDDLNE